MCIIIAPVMAATQYSLEAYTLAPNAKWTSGNTKGYLEGQFVPYRLGITNYPGVATEPQECMQIDYHANSGEYGFDKADFFYIGPVGDTNTPVPSAPPNTYGAGFTPIPTSNAAPVWVDTVPTEVTTSTGTLLQYCIHFNTAPGANFAIYWGSHLARTSYPISKVYGDQIYTPDTSYKGASYYPGSSLHTHATPANRDVSQPTPPKSAEKTGTKFNDLNGNGVWDSGEPGLPGWTIFVDINGDGILTKTGLDPDPFAITGSDGTYHIYGIPAPGSGTTLPLKIREENQDGWACSYPVADCTYTEAFSSGQLVTGNNFGNWQPKPVVTKDAAGSYKTIHHWGLAKTVTPVTQSGFAGDSLPYKWNVVVTDNPTEENRVVTGNIYVTNPAPVGASAMVVGLNDKLNDAALTPGTISGCTGTGVIWTAATQTVSVPANTQAICSYTASPSDHSATQNTVTYTFGQLTSTASHDVQWTETIIDGSATLTDLQNPAYATPQPITPASYPYDDPFTCSVNPADYGDDGKYTYPDPNTATLTFATGSIEKSATETITCYAPLVDKDAKTWLGKTYDWTIDKTVTPDAWALHAGDQAQSKYVVSVTATDAESGFIVNGTIEVKNPNPDKEMKVTVSDVLDDGTGATIGPCSGGTLVGNVLTIPASGTASCEYTASPADTSATLNTVTVALDGLTTSASADVDWNEATVTEVYPQVDVYDKFGADAPVKLGTAYASAGTTTFDAYYQTFTCGESNTYPNKAYIEKPYKEVNRQVDVICKVLDVTIKKDAATEFTRKYEWTIDKTSNDPNLNPTLKLESGQTYLLPYVVTVNAKQLADSGFLVSGCVTTKNNDIRPATITSFSDVISPGSIAPNLDCDPVGVELAASGGELICNYDADLTSAGAAPGTTFGKNEATVALEYPIYFFPWDYPASPAQDIGKGTFDPPAANADIKFASTPTYEWDKCAQINDVTYGVDLGKVCYPDVPKPFNYNKLLGPFPDCQNSEVKNCADFVTEACTTSAGCKTTSTPGEDCFTFIVEVPCPGCTLTPGYWKTHVEPTRDRAPPFDETWTKLDAITTDGIFQGSYEKFFGTGNDWYTVFWTNPKGGNAYYILAHQYEAAVLNTLAGASVPSNVATAINDAAVLLDKYDTNMNGLTGKNAGADRAKMITLAGILGDYNGGALHCDEDGTSGPQG